MISRVLLIVHTTGIPQLSFSSPSLASLFDGNQREPQVALRTSTSFRAMSHLGFGNNQNSPPFPLGASAVTTSPPPSMSPSISSLHHHRCRVHAHLFAATGLAHLLFSTTIGLTHLLLLSLPLCDYKSMSSGRKIKPPSVSMAVGCRSNSSASMGARCREHLLGAPQSAVGEGGTNILVMYNAAASFCYTRYRLISPLQPSRRFGS
jgi:hypothetical protein